MSCVEPIDLSKPWFAPAGFNRGNFDQSIEITWNEDIHAPVIDTLRDMLAIYGDHPQPGDLYLDTAAGDNYDQLGKIFAYDGDQWVPRAVEFDLFDISMVSDPLDNCKLTLTDEYRYDKAMAGI